jgi:hypothetical protein
MTWRGVYSQWRWVSNRRGRAGPGATAGPGGMLARRCGLEIVGPGLLTAALLLFVLYEALRVLSPAHQPARLQAETLEHSPTSYGRMLAPLVW